MESVSISFAKLLKAQSKHYLMAFIKRLGFYLIGLSIGLVFLTIFFKKKSEETGVEFCYLPNCRTLKDIRSKQFSYSPEVYTLLENEQIDSTQIAFFLKEGDVDFNKSDTKTSACKTYVIEGTLIGRPSTIKVRNCQNTAEFKTITFQ